MPNSSDHTSADLRLRIKELMIDRLRLEDLTVDQIGDDTPLWDEAGLGLDSIDALELVTALESELGLRIDDAEMEPNSLATVTQIERLIQTLRSAELDPATRTRP